MTSSVTALHEGVEIPALEREISTADLVKYAGASDDYSPQHWDHTVMVAAGFQGVIVHGWLTFAVLCEAVRRWIPPETAEITAFKVRYHRPHLPGPMSCGGRIARTCRLTLSLTFEATHPMWDMPCRSQRDED